MTLIRALHLSGTYGNYTYIYSMSVFYKQNYLIQFDHLHPMNVKGKNVSNRVYLFWTAGLDSTYRLLHLLFLENKRVQPLYLNFDIDHIQNKTRQRSIETNRLNLLWLHIYKKLGDNSDRLLPIKYKQDSIQLLS